MYNNTELNKIKMNMLKNRYKYNLEDAVNILVRNKRQIGSRDLKLAIEKTEKIFSQYKNSQEPKIDFVFAISTRASKSDATYWGEVYEFFPFLESLSIEDAYAFLVRIPPFKICGYKLEGRDVGAAIFVPVLADLALDIRLKLKLSGVVRGRINDSMLFAKNNLGAEIVGLGGVLPKLTNYGKSINTVLTTTGHAGTTLLLVDTFEGLISEIGLNKDDTVGFIGGGGIGVAAMNSLTKKYPNQNYLIYDKRDDVNSQNCDRLKASNINVRIAADNLELLKESRIVVSAITGQVSVDGINLADTYIIDDSQPGSFAKKEVEDAGGKLVWVAGRGSGELLPKRVGGYRFGPNGLLDDKTYWGCEAELISLYLSQNFSQAVERPVTANDLEMVGSLFERYKISASEFQAYGEKVII